MIRTMRDLWSRRSAALTGEEWRPCPGYEGLYEVSNLGRVKTLGDRHGRVRILRPGPDQTGYPQIALTRDGKRTPKTVHRLIALAFHADKRNAIHVEVAHLDGDMANCRAENLKWVSKVENRFHRRMHGTHDAGENNANAKLTDDAVREIRSYPPYKVDMKELAARYGVSRHTIGCARSGRNWRHVKPQEPAAIARGEE